MRRVKLCVSMLAALLFGACTGDTGPPGPPGPPGEVPPPTSDATTAVEINAEITAADITATPVVDFVLTDENGNGVTGLDPGAISFKLAQLIPGTNGNASRWQSYINEIEQPGVGPGTEPQLQATTENGSAGTLVDNNDGTYQYTFALDVTNVTEPEPIEYQPTLTHRVSFEIRGLAPVRNPHFDVRPDDGATTDLFTRNIVVMERCNACHEDLAFHGGARFETESCVTCHNPGSTDANSGNTVDMTVMTHKIHHGINLPSVGAGEDYCIWGFRDSLHCYGDVVHPQDIRNCSNCHNEEDAETPDAANWYRNPTAEACGSCHDDVDFVTGENHGPTIPATNAECVTCHAANPESRLEVRQAHRILTEELTANYRFTINDVSFAGPGTAPTVTFSVTDPENGDSRYDLESDMDLLASSLRFSTAWTTIDYTNFGNAATNGQPERVDAYSNGVLQATHNGDLTYDLQLTDVPANTAGSGVVTFEGSVTRPEGRVPVDTAHAYFGITDDPANPVPRRMKVDMDRCNDCHERVSFHGSSRNNSIESCQTCHNANAARSGDPSPGPMDVKHFLHRKHAIDDIRYPQRVSNCLACHTEDGFYPVSSDSGVFATSFDQGMNPADPTDNTRASPNSATCGVCHTSSDARAHMTGNGGSYDACTETDGTTRERVNFCGPGGNKSGALVQESCTVCHGPGRFADTADAHSLN